MRLLNTNTLVLHSFVQRIPPYVILSHTWGDGEVTFDDIHQDHAKNMQGYSKIIKCCEQAVRDRYKWTWIDTCCIDKRSSSELSEVINSMYKWYWDAEIYYAFLSDLTSNLDNFHVSDLRLVRWFTRGWCLQELLAPAVVEFYNADWVYMGTKSSAVTNISARTGIDKKYLSDRHSIEQASIATRFSWASCRETTRPEDIAYCLLGLVDVNMPLLYGEGDKAFYRLQLELVQKSNEHTIFAWNPQEFRASHDRLGMLAPHPLAFSNASRINVRNRDDIKTFEMTNSGLRITLNIRWGDEREKDVLLVILNCEDASGHIICISLEPASVTNRDYSNFNGHCFRRPEYPVKSLPPDQVNQARWDFFTILVPGWVAPLVTKVMEAPKITRIRVTLPKKLPEKIRLHKIELDPTSESHRFKNNRRNRLRRDADGIIELPYDTTGGLLFSDDESTFFLLALGSHDKTMWTVITREADLSSCSRVLGDISGMIRQGQDLWKYLGDYHTYGLKDASSTEVIVRAKKKTLQRPIFWTSVNQSLTIWDTIITFYRPGGPPLPAESSLQSKTASE